MLLHEQNSCASHSAVISAEVQWLKCLIQTRIDALKGEQSEISTDELRPPELKHSDSTYSKFVLDNELSPHERLILILALSPHIAPHLLEVFMANKSMQRRSKIASVAKGAALMPTMGTALFLIAGEDMDSFLQARTLFSTEHLFYRKSVLNWISPGDDHLETHKLLTVSQTYVDLLISQTSLKPRFSDEFPAHTLSSNLEWDDLVLCPDTRKRLEEVKSRLAFYDTIVNEHQLAKHSKPGCRILFYGDSGTGKTLAATLLGKYLDRDVFRVDLSTVTSKYIGETSKRLNSLLNTAESKGWILFFDEGDALLGQRKSTDGNNTSQYANQDTAFLLQRFERYDGVIIVATNFKSNIDQAFTRRFEVTVRFDSPDQEQQHQFWMENLPDSLPFDPDVNLPMMINKHPLTPAAIINVIYRVCILTVAAKDKTIKSQLLLTCIRDEELKNKGRSSFVH